MAQLSKSFVIFNKLLVIKTLYICKFKMLSLHYNAQNFKYNVKVKELHARNY